MLQVVSKADFDFHTDSPRYGHNVVTGSLKGKFTLDSENPIKRRKPCSGNLELHGLEVTEQEHLSQMGHVVSNKLFGAIGIAY